MGITSRVEIPYAMLTPDAIPALAPRALLLRVLYARAISFNAGHSQFPQNDFLRQPSAQQHRLVRRGAGPQREYAARRIEIAPTDVAAQRLIHGIVPNHIRQIFQTQRNLLNSMNIMPLQIYLYRIALYFHSGSEIVTSEKEAT